MNVLVTDGTESCVALPTAGHNITPADFGDVLYGNIITEGAHKTHAIKVVKQAKVIENTQCDLSIVMANDLGMLLKKYGIDILDVLEADGTKSHFLPFHLGLVGGHCISVDPYYLIHKMQEVGRHLQGIILVGRRTNDGTGPFVADQCMNLMVRKGINPASAHVPILTLAFKGDCRDLCNTCVVNAAQVLQSYNAGVDVLHPLLDGDDAHREYGLRSLPAPEPRVYDAIGLAVGHDEWGGRACVRQTARQRGLQRKERAVTRRRRRAVVSMQLSPNSTFVCGGFVNGVSSAANASSDAGIQLCHFGNGCVKSVGLDWEPSR